MQTHPVCCVEAVWLCGYVRAACSSVSVMSIGDGRAGLRRGGGIDAAARAGPAPLAFDFPSPGDGGGALHNSVAALRARSRPERSRARRTRPHAVYVTRDHRARPLTPARARWKCPREVCSSPLGLQRPLPARRRLVGAAVRAAFVRARGGDGCGRVLNN